MKIKTTLCLTLVTGRKIASTDCISEVQEAIEAVTGRPIWSHELKDQTLWQELRQITLASKPELSVWGAAVEALVEAEARSVAFLAIGRKAVEHLGPELEITPVPSKRTETPAESFDRLYPNARSTPTQETSE